MSLFLCGAGPARRLAQPLALAALTLPLGGCFYANTAQVPVATTYPYSEQQRMQAAHHWDVLAGHEAGGIVTSQRLRLRDLYLRGSAETANSAFGGEFRRGFKDLLASRLVARGASVTTAPTANSVTLTFRVEVIHHRDRGFTRPPVGAYTALAGGVAVATLPYNQWSEPALGLIPAAVGADIVSGSWTYTGNEEVIITVQAVEDERILYSSSNIYYINSGDRRHYAPHRVAPQTPPTPAIPVTDAW
ncbi:hypothetical protein GCM10022228_06520 [Halomonas cibimaris]|uniref:DUF3313 domain-containing protein n=1 Tax=Halomonas cibimaris TaxID=657012 RepID=A0ABP7LFC9_9GAMM